MQYTNRLFNYVKDRRWKVLKFQRKTHFPLTIFNVLAWFCGSICSLVCSNSGHSFIHTFFSFLVLLWKPVTDKSRAVTISRVKCVIKNVNTTQLEGLRIYYTLRRRTNECLKEGCLERDSLKLRIDMSRYKQYL